MIRCIYFFLFKVKEATVIDKKTETVAPREKGAAAKKAEKKANEKINEILNFLAPLTLENMTEEKKKRLLQMSPSLAADLNKTLPVVRKLTNSAAELRAQIFVAIEHVRSVPQDVMIVKALHKKYNADKIKIKHLEHEFVKVKNEVMRTSFLEARKNQMNMDAVD